MSILKSKSNSIKVKGNAVKSEAVLVESVEIVSEKMVFAAEMETLNSDVVYRLSGEGEEDIVIPARYMPWILENGRYLTNQMQASKVEAQRLYGNPAGKYDFLKEEDNKKGRVFYVEGTDIKEEGIPMLEWMPEVLEDLRYNRAYRPSGWRVVLSGATDSTFLFIRWDNLESLDKAIKDLPKKDSITAMMSLTNPEATSKLASRKAFLDLKSAKNLPAVKMTAIRKMIITHNLHTDSTISHWNTGSLSSLFVKVGEVRVPVAIRVEPSTKTSWGLKLTPEEEELHWKVSQARQEELDKANLEEWWRRFKAAMATDLPGWYQVSIPNRDWSNRVNTEPESFWMTRVPRATWEIIAPAARDTAKHNSFRESRF